MCPDNQFRLHKCTCERLDDINIIKTAALHSRVISPSQQMLELRNSVTSSSEEEPNLNTVHPLLMLYIHSISLALSFVWIQCS